VRGILIWTAWCFGESTDDEPYGIKALDGIRRLIWPAYLQGYKYQPQHCGYFIAPLPSGKEQALRHESEDICPRLRTKYGYYPCIVAAHEDPDKKWIWCLHQLLLQVAGWEVHISRVVLLIDF